MISRQATSRPAGDIIYQLSSLHNVYCQGEGLFNFITASPRRGEGWCGGPGVLKLLDRKIMAGLRGCELRSSPS